jgi:hypothetical protein
MDMHPEWKRRSRPEMRHRPIVALARYHIAREKSGARGLCLRRQLCNFFQVWEPAGMVFGLA